MTTSHTDSRPLAVITGASSGIGQALADRYLRAGYRLALFARRDEELRRWAAERGLDERACGVYRADVADVDAVVQAGQRCLADMGVPQVVIANAGISVGMDTAQREDISVLSRTFATNNVGMAATFHPFVAAMRARGQGALVGIASVAAIRGLPGHGAYCASKAAVVAYCESLRGELRGSGVAVVTLLPGYVDTPLTQENRYAMPFLLSPEVFADRAFKAIEAGMSYRVIPWQMGVVAKLLRALPNAWFDRLLAGRPRKHREGEGRH
ncbi:MAG: SDR family oxidoreductase [Hydrogenophaga sp.]|uniref:SDR family oxidoreductase n=1 Tax=Hydrogenophaga sp. TaxID=1904254 RepID=UPI001DBB8474|nr:SDR family oxidoreductase [Hydrogenophaga sp.]MBX3608827.1 SDR family oxidoreductase [Hydrogenophaga sp.]